MCFNPVVPDEPILGAGNGPRQSRRRRPRWWVAGAIVAVLVVGIVTVAVVRNETSSGSGDGAAPVFQNDTSTAGIDHAYAGEFEFFVGGGVAAFDCDDDRLPDLFFAGGTDPAALYRNESPIGGALRFEHVVSEITDLTQVTGAYPIDIDSDGLMDLAVLRRGANVMLRGVGDCRFEDANASLGLDGGDDWTAAFSATWEGTDTLPTLAFGNYLVPDSDTCADSELVRPAPEGDSYAAAGRTEPRVLHAVCAFQRLEPVGTARPAHVERPPLLHRRRGAAVADRAGRGSAPLHGSGRLEADADLGDGHRQPGRDRRRLPRGVPHEPGRQQTADARERS